MNRDVANAVNYIRRGWDRDPTAAVVLGSGLGGLASELSVEQSLPYESIPGFPGVSALGHAGQLVCGRIGSVPVVALQGRAHFYEGFEFEDLAFPVQVIAGLGTRVLIVSNACGGLNPQMAAGELMLICDHIDFMGKRSCQRRLPSCPVVGRSMSCYDPDLIAQAHRIAVRLDIPCHRGVYVAVTGPNYETRAEYRALRRLGGDVVGMSTVPEVLAAAACGLRVLAVSAVTNVACPDVPTSNDPQQVVNIAQVVEPQLRAIVSELVSTLDVR